jgi:hypothetical protein
MFARSLDGSIQAYSLRTKLLVVLAFLENSYCYVSRHNYISRSITKEKYLEKPNRLVIWGGGSI